MTALVEQEINARGVAEVMVVLKEPIGASVDTSPMLSGTVAAADMGATTQSILRHFIVDETSQTMALASAASAGRTTRPRERTALGRGEAVVGPMPPHVRYYPYLGVILGTVNPQGLKALSHEGNVDRITGTPAISLIRPEGFRAARAPKKLTWGLRSMRVQELWRQGLTGEGVLVGHLDTGVDCTHPVLQGAIAHFAEFDDFGREVTPTSKAFDTDFHGTHTAATIAGRGVVGQHVGMAPGAALASAIVIEGGNVFARVLGGMDWAISRSVRILNMSLGFRGYWEDFLPLTQILRNRNIIPVFAVGNEGPGTSRSPGNYSESISVGAHDRTWKIADFSSSQRFARLQDSLVPDLVCPGVEIVSAVPGGKFLSIDGSSMATPHLSGLAALLLQAKPSATVDDIEQAILQSCELKPGMLPDRANRGVPDAVRALSLL